MGAVGYDGVSGSARVAEDWARRGFKGSSEDRVSGSQGGSDVIRACDRPSGRIGDHGRLQPKPYSPVEAVQRLRVLDNEGLTWVRSPRCHDYEVTRW